MVTMVGEPQVGAHSLYAEASLPDATPVNPPMIYDGSVVTQILIPSGQFIISDLYLGFGFVYWVVEVDFGAGYVDYTRFGFTLLAPLTTEVKKFKTPITINGGPGVKMRLRVEAVTFPVDVNCTIRCRMQG